MCEQDFMYRDCYACQLLMKLEVLLADFSQNTQISNFMKIRLVWAELFDADGRPDIREDPNGRFLQFFRCPEHEWNLWKCDHI
jgi:hypothetical protein